MSTAIFTVAVEGPTDVPVVRRILQAVGAGMNGVHGRRGKARLDARLPGYNRAAARSPWLVLRDLDHDAPCAGHLARSLLPGPAPQMCFRIAVRETESWLLADRERMARFLGVAVSRVPTSPDGLDDPKRELVNLARGSRQRDLREDVVPFEGSSAPVGPGYLARIQEFSERHWRPEVAAAASPSLSRCLAALRSVLATVGTKAPQQRAPRPRKRTGG